jgi:hypothetical protein
MTIEIGEKTVGMWSIPHSSEAECDHGQRAGEALRGAP